MPSDTEKQARTMAAAAHSPAFAKKVGIPQKVAKDFNQADKGTKLLSSAMKHSKPFHAGRQMAAAKSLRKSSDPGPY